MSVCVSPVTTPEPSSFLRKYLLFLLNLLFSIRLFSDNPYCVGFVSYTNTTMCKLATCSNQRVDDEEEVYAEDDEDGEDEDDEQ